MNLLIKCIRKKAMRWGSSLPGLGTQDPPLRPASSWVEIFRRTCLQSHLQKSPPTPQKSYPKLWNPRTTFENTPPLSPPVVVESSYFFYLGPSSGNLGNFFKRPPFSAQKSHSAGVDIFLLESFCFCDLSPCKISEPYDNPFWGFIYGMKKREEARKKN